ncbi:HDOD domain-containing protein [Hydrogenophaga sp.]|uniref:HDOD domain-containing protein n=1 Tax=Hydrogenophaga sp. TaxID=1904254 RepID=UPI0035699253
MPSAPEVVRKLMLTFNQEDVDIMMVASYIEDDPILTAKLLKVANSAFFGLTRAITSAQDAINVMGLVKVRALVVSAALGQGFHCVGGVNLNQFWRYSLNSANLSQYIAHPIKIDEGTAFTTGLIHAIGELVMHAGMPEAMIDLDRSVAMLDLKRARAEKGMFGYTYAEVGAALARDWNFPKNMVEVIEHQVNPFDNGVYEPIAGVVHMASWRARAEELSLGNAMLISSYPDPIGNALGMDPDILVGDDIPPLAHKKTPVPA